MAPCAWLRVELKHMPRTTTHSVIVQFGDCDPGGIVFFPNFLRWMDASSLMYFSQCGVPPWRTLEQARGIVGTPLLEINTRFHKTATLANPHLHTHVQEWAAPRSHRRTG